ncbi:MAG: alcohol dehydrogenase catalytic domain-containing protein, partial [Vicinamibacterales bacterium]
MIAIEINGAGGPEVLRPVERQTPEPGVEDVLIRVHAAGVNRPDILQRQGAYPPPPGASDIPGLELSGTVVRIGEWPEGETCRWAPGDAVCALVTGGGYAEYAIAPARQCLPVPTGMDFVRAAAIPETYFTVWTNLFQRGQLQTGSMLLV